VPSCVIEGKTVVVDGTLLKVASIKEATGDEGIGDPESFVYQLRHLAKADLFTFDRKLPDTESNFNYYFEWDNVAAIRITSAEAWWNNQIHNDARRMVRKATKNNVVVKVVPFSEELVRGIKSIYDETPMRQGKRFWHYGKDYGQVKKDKTSFLERSDFIGAFYKGELIGFTKIVYTGKRADALHLISKIKDRDKAPTNALIAKAVEVCASKGMTYLTYDRFEYGNRGVDSLSDFKMRNGFVKVPIPRYFIPLSLKGKIALKLKLHRTLVEFLPNFLIDIFLRMRTKAYRIKYRRRISRNIAGCSRIVEEILNAWHSRNPDRQRS